MKPLSQEEIEHARRQHRISRDMEDSLNDFRLREARGMAAMPPLFPDTLPQEPEMDPDEPTIELSASIDRLRAEKGILIGMMIGTAIWLAIALVIWFTFCGGE